MPSSSLHPRHPPARVDLTFVPSTARPSAPRDSRQQQCLRALRLVLPDSHDNHSLRTHKTWTASSEPRPAPRPTRPWSTPVPPSPTCMERTTLRRWPGRTGSPPRRRQKCVQTSSRKSCGTNWKTSTLPIRRCSCWRTCSCWRGTCGLASPRMRPTTTTCCWR